MAVPSLDEVRTGTGVLLRRMKATPDRHLSKGAPRPKSTQGHFNTIMQPKSVPGGKQIGGGRHITCFMVSEKERKNGEKDII